MKRFQLTTILALVLGLACCGLTPASAGWPGVVNLKPLDFSHSRFPLPASAVDAPPRTFTVPTLRGTALAAAALPSTADGPYAVAKVVDGDTLRLWISGGKQYVRQLGDDAPELHTNRHGHASPWGPLARAHLAALIGKQQVYLEHDAEHDLYGRTLAYIELPDGTDLAQKMVADGYALSYVYDKKPCSRQAVYDAAQASAQAAKLGMWGPLPDVVKLRKDDGE